MPLSEGQSLYTVEVPLETSGELVRVQVNDAGEGLVRVGRGNRAVARAEQSLDSSDRGPAGGPASSG
ncbi:hypothetical protein [Streptomyces anulatus]|uniref:hypothetical protein n=1 Tax=Streptomyces anulatus TaxID=1892 RepID=UPI0035DE22D2